MSNSSNIFEEALPVELESINCGAERYTLDQLYPISGNIQNVFVGQGSASGITTFTFSDSNMWWSPQLSYFLLQVQFVKATANGMTAQNVNTGVIPTSDFVAPCDLFPSTFFSQIKSQINSRQLDIIDQPWIIDTALTYADCKKDFNASFNSMSYSGKPLMTRIVDAASNGGFIEVCYKPPISLFSCKALPCGAAFRFDFNWAPNANNAFEFLYAPSGVPPVIGTAAGNYNVIIKSFSFYKANLGPSPKITLPTSGVIDLSPTIINQYFLNGSNTLRQNITMPSTTNRILCGISESNASIAYADPNSGPTPATSFQYAVSNGSNVPFAMSLMQAYLTLPELGVQIPNPVYTFAPVAAGNATFGDWTRAYSDFVKITQGDGCGTESGLALGNFDPTVGITANVILNPLATGTALSTVVCAGDPTNTQGLQLYSINTASTTSPEISVTTATTAATGLTVTLTCATATLATVSRNVACSTFAQTSRWGWLGTRPGPMLAFPVVRGDNKSVSTGNLNLTFSGSGTVANCIANIICTYSMALQLQHVGNGLYSYNLVEGI